MFLSGLFITVLYSVSYLVFTITGKADRKLTIVMNSSHRLHSSLSILNAIILQDMYTHTKVAELVTYANSKLAAMLHWLRAAVSLKGICLRPLLLNTVTHTSLTAVYVERYD